MKPRYQWLTGALEKGGVVVTANRRLARELREVHGEMQRESGKRAWPTPDILFITDWLDRLLEGGPLDDSMPVRIDAQASSVLWERCVEESILDSLPGVSGIVRQCKQSWVRLQDWCVPLNEITARAAGAEQKQFAAAVRQYTQLLSRNNWVDNAGLIKATVTGITAKRLKDIPTHVCLAGFDRISPAVEELLQELGSNGVEVLHADSPEIASAIATSTHRDQDSELRAAGAWARRQLSDDPTLHIAIICADLETNANQVARLVREGFAPGWQIAGSSHRDAVNISYGRTLADYPAVRVALMLLRWVHEGLPSRDVSVLLRSRSVVGGMTGGRSRLEQKLRRIPDRSWYPQDLLDVLAGPDGDADATAWSACIAKIAEAKLSYRELAGPAQWAARFDQLMTDAGWPGAESLDSHEFQLLNRWRELLNEFARLDRVMPVISFQAAVARLNQIASDTVFQPESDHGVLPVLGTLEAAGMEFDKVWVTAFDARYWPANGNPLAYVSRQLQKDAMLPDATPQDTLEFSRRVCRRILHRATEVILSWPLADGDVPVQPSPLLPEIEGAASIDVVDPGWYASTMLKCETIALVTDNPVPGVGEDERISGGAYTVQRQANDPFSAFASGRLRVGELQSFQSGLSARIRGNAIHSALSNLFSDHPSRSKIQDWSDDECARKIGQASARSLARHEKHASTALLRMIQLEQDRIKGILYRFVTEERSREQFQVAMTEQQLEYTGHGIRLSLRVDRVDRLADNSVLVIDYKTGAEKTLLNRAGELNDLQLMVYALALQPEYTIGGIAIINLDARKISFKGAGQDSEWAGRYSRWGAEANAAIRAIARGDARVNMQLSTDQSRPLNILSRFEELRRDQ